MDTERIFLVTDDRSPNFYVGRINRKPSELKPPLKSLGVGETYYPKNSTIGYERES